MATNWPVVNDGGGGGQWWQWWPLDNDHSEKEDKTKKDGMERSRQKSRTHPFDDQAVETLSAAAAAATFTFYLPRLIGPITCHRLSSSSSS